MTEPAYDLVIRGGRVATMSDVFEADVAVSGETIVARSWPSRTLSPLSTVILFM